MKGELTYHVASGLFKFPDLPWITAFCMGLAKHLVIEDEAEERVVYTPEYLHGMLGCEPLYWIFEQSHDNEDGEPGTDDLNTQRFGEMNADLLAWRGRHIGFTRLVIARHIVRMIADNVFGCLVMETDAESVAERLQSHDIDVPSEIDGGYKILLCSIPLEDGVVV